MSAGGLRRGLPAGYLWLLAVAADGAMAGSQTHAPSWAHGLPWGWWLGGLLVAATAGRARPTDTDILGQLSSTILDVVGALVVVLDSAGHLLRFNRACEELTGWTSDEVLGRSLWDVGFLVPDEVDGVRAMFAELLAGHGSNQHQHIWLTRTGEQRVIAWHNTGLTDCDGAVQLVIATGVDVTEQRRAEAALRLDDLRLESLVKLNEMKYEPLHLITDYVLEAAVRLTRSRIGYLAFLNEDETVLTMHSWSKAAMAECAIQDKPLVYPVEDTGLWGEAVRQRKPVITNDYEAPNPLKRGYPEGHVRVTRHLNIPVFDGARIVVVAGIGNKDEDYDEADIRQLSLLMKGMWQLLQRKQMTEDLRQARVGLEARVLARTQELEAANAALAAEVAEREYFVYAASHDLQEPLRKIGAFGALLQQDCGDGLSTEGRHYLDRMVDAAGRMRQLIDGLLAYSRVTTQHHPPEYVSLAQEAAAALEDLALRLQETGGRVTVDAPHVVMADPVQVRELLQNLIGNALKFARRDVAPQVQVSSELLPDGMVELTVADNGIGFEPKYLERIFRPFQRLHGRQEYAGTGMGLAICEKIATHHGGAITAHSEPGQGSRFSVRLPGTSEQTEGG